MREKIMAVIRKLFKDSYAYLSIPLLFLVLSAFFSFWLFLIELLVIAVLVAALWLGWFHRKTSLRSTLIRVTEDLETINRETLSAIPLPVMVVDAEGELIWYNDRFFKRVLGEEEVDRNFYHTLIHILPTEFSEEEIVQTEYKGKSYSVFAMYNNAPTNDFYTLYFYDETKSQEAIRRYESTRPNVCLVVFDNRDDLMQGSVDSVSARAVADVERILESWSDNYGGMLRRLKNDRFMVILEQGMLEKAIEHRFTVLEKVRQIKVGEKVSATLSIGVGRSDGGIHESADWAKQALDMALGRGGDQVVIKSDDSYEFFGGVSKGVEKRNQVRTRVVATALCELIGDSENIMLMSHRFSDLDSVGSGIGMWSAIKKGLKKTAYLVSDQEESMAEALLAEFSRINPGAVLSPEEAILRSTSRTLLIITDTHSPDFLECRELYERCKNVVVIDHHRMMVNYIKDAAIFYQEPYASSACELVVELIEYFPGVALSGFEANALLLGIILDTKNFSQRTGARTFEAAAALKRKGADTVEVKRLFSSSFEAYKLKSQIVSEAQIQNKSAVALTSIQSADIRIASSQAADDLLGVEGVEASYVLFLADGAVNISARSYGEINVQLVMEAIGGGGHQTMAGAQLTGVDIQQVRDRLLEIIRTQPLERVNEQ